MLVSTKCIRKSINICSVLQVLLTVISHSRSYHEQTINSLKDDPYPFCHTFLFVHPYLISTAVIDMAKKQCIRVGWGGVGWGGMVQKNGLLGFCFKSKKEIPNS